MPIYGYMRMIIIAKTFDTCCEEEYAFSGIFC